MKIRAKETLAAVGPMVDRLADLSWAHHVGDITDREYVNLRAYYNWLFAVAWAKDAARP